MAAGSSKQQPSAAKGGRRRSSPGKQAGGDRHSNNASAVASDDEPSKSTSISSSSSSAIVVAFVIYCAVPLAFIGLAGVWNDPGGSALVNDLRSLARGDVGPPAAASPPEEGHATDTNNKMHPRARAADRSSDNNENEDTPSSSGGNTGGGAKYQIDEYIGKLRTEHMADPGNVHKALNLAESLRQRDLSIHDGGSAQAEAIQLFEDAVDLILEQRRELIRSGRPTKSDGQSLNQELFLDTNSKSTDGLLVATYCSLAKMYFMANMFERAVKAYDAALDLSSGDYLDALVYRASTLIILGRYEQAAKNYARALELDTNRLFVDVYTGLSKVLVAKEEAVGGGWKTLVDVIETELPQKESQLAGLSSLGNQQQAANTKSVLVDAIKRMHLAMFSYHDTKTKDAEKAWEHLSSAYRHKMSILPPWNGQQEANRVAMVKQIFQPGFWPEHVGSDSQTPIFVIGFVRSGSTLLERILDAHSQIVGTGEDSMFNGQLDTIRNKIVQASTSGNPMVIQRTVQALADKVVDDMTARFWSIENATAASAADHTSSNERIQKADPKRFVDKMLTNYMNVGFIHMLFPQALILHVSREPMDCVFSAFKHDFPPGTLDYTSDFPSLAQLYLGYREMMDHWDRALPGRVTHVRYEDMVEDLPAVARALIDATGLPWEEDVLDFHKKKQAVNTLSTSQVRKGMYKDHFKAWKKYEKELQPLVELLGDNVEHVARTTIPGYQQS